MQPKGNIYGHPIAPCLSTNAEVNRLPDTCYSAACTAAAQTQGVWTGNCGRDLIQVRDWRTTCWNKTTATRSNNCNMCMTCPDSSDLVTAADIPYRFQKDMSMPLVKATPWTIPYGAQEPGSRNFTGSLLEGGIRTSPPCFWKLINCFEGLQKSIITLP